MARTTLPSVPGLNNMPGLGARNTASAMEAIQNALQFYLKLKSQQDDEKNKQREMTRQEAGQQSLNKYYESQAANLGEDNRRAEQDSKFKRAAQLADLYGGTRLPAGSKIPQQFEEAGYPKELAFSPEMTLPASRLPGSMPGMPQGPAPQSSAPTMPQGGAPPYFKPAPQAETGAQIMNETEGSKLRGQQAGIAARAAEGSLNRDAANNRAQLSHEDKVATLKQQGWYQALSTQLRQQGLNNQARYLDLALTAGLNTVDNQTFQHGMEIFKSMYEKSGPEAFLRSMGIELPGAVAQPKPPVAPVLRKPGGIAQPSAAPAPTPGKWVEVKPGQ